MNSRCTAIVFACTTLIAAAAIHVARAQVPLPEEIDYAPMLVACDSQKPLPSKLHCEVSKAFEKIQTIRQGSTRGDLVKLFTLSGGLSSSRGGTYDYRESFLIHVDVEFATLDPKAGSLSDVITKISRPYIANPIAD